MNPDEIPQDGAPEVPPEDVTPEVTPEVPETIPEVVPDASGTADPLDAIEDINELRKVAKAHRSTAQRYKKDSKQPKPQSSTEVKTVSSQPNIEETILLANGMSEELVDKLKSVAKVNGISSLIKAQKDPIFVAIKEKFEKDQKQREANLPASRGAGGVKAQKTFSTPGLTREEHRKLVMESRE